MTNTTTKLRCQSTYFIRYLWY